MSTRTWIGGAQAVAQVTDWVLGGTWEATDVINIVIGTRTVSVVAGSTSIPTILDNLIAALNASTQPEFEEITWTEDGADTLTGTADTAGLPFVCTISTTETGGGAADAQTIDGGTSSAGTDSTACTGPNHADEAQNWSGATLPVDADTIIFADTAVDCLYGLDGLSGVTAAVLEVRQTFTGKIGLPAYNSTGAYAEYRGRYLQFEAATSLVVGKGEGQGSNRVNLDTGSAGATAALVLNTGTPIDGEQAALNWKSTHSSSTLTVQKGTVGVALFPSETATIATLKVAFQRNPAGDAKVYLGEGVTLTTITQTGGVLHTRSNLTTFTLSGGEWKHFAGTVTTLNCNGGSCRYRSTGTCTTCNVRNGGEMDFREDISSRTFTTINLYDGYKWRDLAGSVSGALIHQDAAIGSTNNILETPVGGTWTRT